MNTPKSRPARRNRPGQVLAVAAALGLAAALAACGPQDPTGAGTPATSSAAPATNTASPAPTTEAAPSTTASPTGNATEIPAVPLCTASSLTGALDDTGGGAAGHIYMNLVLTNTSTNSCIVDGYPGVSMVLSGSTDPIGAPAERDAREPSNGPITLAPGQHADALLRYTQAGNYQDCDRVQAASILVYPPSATDSLEIPHPLTACSNADIKLLSIGAFQL